MVVDFAKEELELIQSHEKILEKRRSLMEGSQCFFNFKKSRTDSFLWDAKKAKERNIRLYQELTGIGKNLNKQMAECARIGKLDVLKNNYWTIVKSIYPIWQEEMARSNKHNGGHQANSETTAGQAGSTTTRAGGSKKYRMKMANLPDNGRKKLRFHNSSRDHDPFLNTQDSTIVFLTTKENQTPESRNALAATSRESPEPARSLHASVERTNLVPSEEANSLVVESERQFKSDDKKIKGVNDKKELKIKNAVLNFFKNKKKQPRFNV